MRPGSPSNFGFKVSSYLRVGYLLHLITLLELGLLAFIYQKVRENNLGGSGTTWWKALVVFSFFCFPLFPQLDARSRFQNYKLLRDRMYLYGFQLRIISPFSKSRCQRDALMAAAEDMGFSKECKAYFKKSGYRWFHLFPDFLLQNPEFLFTKNFWLTTFFVKRYHSRFLPLHTRNSKSKEISGLVVTG